MFTNTNQESINIINERLSRVPSLNTQLELVTGKNNYVVNVTTDGEYNRALIVGDSATLLNTLKTIESRDILFLVRWGVEYKLKKQQRSSGLYFGDILVSQWRCYFEIKSNLSTAWGEYDGDYVNIDVNNIEKAIKTVANRVTLYIALDHDLN